RVGSYVSEEPVLFRLVDGLAVLLGVHVEAPAVGADAATSGPAATIAPGAAIGSSRRLGADYAGAHGGKHGFRRRIAEDRAAVETLVGWNAREVAERPRQVHVLGEIVAPLAFRDMSRPADDERRALALRR